MRKFIGKFLAAFAIFGVIGVAIPASAVPPMIDFYFGSSVSQRWVDTAVSANGLVGYAALNTTVGYDDKISKTTDGGQTFTTLDSSPAGSYIAIDASADGKTVFAVYTDGSQYLVTRSIDAGATWKFMFGNVSNQIYDIAVSADGQVVLVAFGSVVPMYSLDGGANWSVGATPPSSLERVDVSGDGSKMVAGGGAIALTSNDNAASWTQVTVAASSYVSAVSVSLDGSDIMVTTQQGADGDVYYSHDGGTTFTSGGRASIYNGSVQGAYQTMSADGNTMLWSYYGSPLYMSRDGGSTWDQVASGAGWLSFGISDDGLRGYALAEGGHVQFFAPKPEISGINPAAGRINRQFTINIHGQYFSPNCVVNDGTEDLPTTFVSTTKLTAVVNTPIAKMWAITLNCNFDEFGIGYSSALWEDAFVTLAPSTTVANTLVVTGTHVEGATIWIAIALLLGGAVIVMQSRKRHA